ncbi:MAG: SpoIID/LytB domain-containing protein [Candidatus Sumerlaeaceae bacterium]|nr:SpoIID/LytB domain-containing protein [Candidatus Sumerlaeaceae bacterium]
MKLDYKDELGPPVRIGILQHQNEIRVTLQGRYRIYAGGGGTALPSGDLDLICSVEYSKKAVLQYRIVLKKCFSSDAADAVTSPSAELEPLQTIKLGPEIEGPASALEYWRCSRPFETEAAAEEVRDKLPRPERMTILKESVQRPSGIIHARPAKGGQHLPAEDWMRFEPKGLDECRAIVHDVIVGVDYHWRHFERQRFRGAVEVRIDNEGKLTVVNELPMEVYLFSVNSSEMMSVMPDELLKAQTVAARNTTFATMGKHHYADAFDLCADDHCQCYRGSSRETPDSRRVTLATVGEVMTHDGSVCDARYSKMCGGIIESFDSVWHEDPRAYLAAGIDAEPGSDVAAYFPANTEERAAALINARPKCWCNTTQGDVPPYLRYSAPYFRWTQKYTREELEVLLARYFGGKVGELKDLVPLSRGASGRIEYLKVVTSDGEWTIGKEFQIRKALSKTFLYSSAFIPEFERDVAGAVVSVTLKGGGWGHGAGLCQVGATMMAYHKKTYREILLHYYPESEIVALSPPASAAKIAEHISKRESRDGDRCFEFYNCYAVAQCPVYLEKVSLEAQEMTIGFEVGDNQASSFVFHQTQKGAEMDLEARKVECQFLKFSGPSAVPK